MGLCFANLYALRDIPLFYGRLTVYAGVMLSIARSRYTSLSQVIFLAFNAFGLLFGTIYNANTPDLYENNAHHKIGWIATWIMSAHTIVGLVRYYARAHVPSESFPGIRYDRFEESHSANEYRWSRDSGQGTEPSTPDAEPEDKNQPNPQRAQSEDDEEKLGLLSNSVMDRFFMRKVEPFVSTRFLRMVSVPYNVTDRLILFLGFIAFATGIVTYGGHFVSRARWRNESPSL